MCVKFSTSEILGMLSFTLILFDFHFIMLDILGVLVCGMLGSKSGGIVAWPISIYHIITKRRWFWC